MQQKGLASTAHADAMRVVFGRRASQGLPADIVFLGASTLEGLDARAFGEGAVNLAVGGNRLSDVRRSLASQPFLKEARTIVLLAGFNDLKRQDVLEAFKIEQIKRTL